MLWPAFAAAVVVQAVLLEALPVTGDDGPGLFAAFLLGGLPRTSASWRWPRRWRGAGCAGAGRDPDGDRHRPCGRGGARRGVCARSRSWACCTTPTVRAARDDLSAQAAQARQLRPQPRPA